MCHSLDGTPPIGSPLDLTWTSRDGVRLTLLAPVGVISMPPDIRQLTLPLLPWLKPLSSRRRTISTIMWRGVSSSISSVLRVSHGFKGRQEHVGRPELARFEAERNDLAFFRRRAGDAGALIGAYAQSIYAELLDNRPRRFAARDKETPHAASAQLDGKPT